MLQFFVLLVGLGSGAHLIPASAEGVKPIILGDLRQYISGTIRKSPENKYFLFLQNQEWLLLPSSEETKSNLHKLADGDLLIGFGHFAPTENVLHLAAVDFVGLQRILGVWASSTDLVNFENFELMSLTPRNLPPPERTLEDPLQPVIQSLERTKNYFYAMSPGTQQSDQWILILSDDQGERLATMNIFEDRSILRLYDPESGALVRELELFKL